MRLINNSNYNLLHRETCLLIGRTAEVSEDLARVWLAYEGVTEVPQEEPVKREIESEAAVDVAVAKVKGKTTKRASKKKVC